MKNRFWFIFGGFLWLLPALKAQQSVDSLWQIWQSTGQHDTVRLRAIHGIGFAYVFHDPDSALLMARLETDFARQKGWKAWEARGLNIQGLCYRYKSNYAQAFKSYQESIRLLEEVGDNLYLSKVYGNMGDVYRLQSNSEKAIESIYKSLQLAEQAGDQKTMADAYVSIAIFYYEEPENYQKTLEYLEKALAIYSKLGEQKGLAQVYSNFSAVYLDLEDYKSSLLYTEKALEKHQAMGNLYGVANALFNRAIVLSIRGMYQAAMHDFNRVVEIYQKMGDIEAEADAFNGMGDAWIQQQQYDRAIVACQKSLDLLKTFGPSLRHADACNCLYNAYFKKKNYGKALAYLEQFIAVKDSLQQNETEEKLRMMELDRQAFVDSLGREKEKYLMELSHQTDLRRRDRNMGWLVIAGIIMLAIAIGFWVRMTYFQKRSKVLQNRSDVLEKQQLQNEIVLLKTQVNPHFLFNSLSILSSLVYTDANLAEQFIHQLSRSYRYILEQKDQSLVSLQTELDFIKSYSFLLKIRFGDKLQLRMDIPDHLLESCQIAPLTLQLLIENAVKHNRMSEKEPLVVHIYTESDHTLIVQNRLQLRNTAVLSTGIGLQNIINRYALLSDLPVLAGETEDAFIVRIPLIDIPQK
ncbi:MAG: tetratricopeptide repeat protein [Chitinophagales bacterium]|nr:tetratricopeptide repeat protein [Chitinophagales bacterium]